MNFHYRHDRRQGAQRARLDIVDVGTGTRRATEVASISTIHVKSERGAVVTTVPDAFRAARKTALHHMRACEDASLRWGETSITEMVTADAARAVTVVPFTQPAEAVSGADWVWWWVDSQGAYGMLVQAKRVTIANGAWGFDFDYRAAKSERNQREVLRSTAASLGLLPVFALYLGTGTYRDWERCSKAHTGIACHQCKRRAVSIMPEILASSSMVTDSASTYRWSVALEDLWIRSRDGGLLIPAVKKQLTSELADFLQTPQQGVRAVTRSMIDLVLNARYGQFNLATEGTQTLADGGHDALGRIFTEFPDDTMHGGIPYFERLLEPLRHAPPDYVMEAVHGEPADSRVAAAMPENVAGIVVVDLSDERDPRAST